MIPVFVITLREEPWKWKTMVPHFKSHGIEPRIIYGVSGSALGLRPTNAYTYDKGGVPEYSHPCHVACALSHLTALQCGILSGSEEFIVAEDDALLPKDFTARWNAIRSAVPDDLDVLQCNVHLSADKVREPLNQQLSRSYYPFGSAFNWWRREAAERAINMLRPVDSPLDIMLIRRVFPFMSHAVPTKPFILQRTIEGMWPSSIGDKLNS